MKEDKVGEIKYNNFGSKMIIKKYRKYEDIDVYFPEYNWEHKKAAYNNFKKGNLKCPYEPRIYNKGYIGVGKHNPTANKKMYSIWHGMLKRCYDENRRHRDSSYINCTVCDEWLNFQNFASWYEENYYEIDEKTMCLDKDILLKNNKIYSPDTCIFVPNEINVLFTKRQKNRGEYPIGVSVHKKHKNEYQSRCRINGKIKHLGIFNTPEEAFHAYKIFKESYIKQIADEYKELIPEILYDALYNYTVDLDD